MDFVALDVETANADLASICQVGLIRFSGGHVAARISQLCDPQDDFDPYNVAIHGIEEGAVAGQPTLPDVYEELRGWLDGAVVAIHTPFDRRAVACAADRWGLTPPKCRWLDTARVARRAWPAIAPGGYRLATLAARFDIEYRAHDAAEDARAAGLVLLQAIRETGLSLAEWLDRSERPIDVAPAQVLRRDGNPDGPLAGEVLVFTGALALPRRLAADLAAAAGCAVAASVTRRTTLLVVGDQDVTKLAGAAKSSKHRKAESLIAAGQRIRILRESDFQAICKTPGP